VYFAYLKLHSSFKLISFSFEPLNSLQFCLRPYASATLGRVSYCRCVRRETVPSSLPENINVRWSTLRIQNLESRRNNSTEIFIFHTTVYSYFFSAYHKNEVFYVYWYRIIIHRIRRPSI
jgi:hypothetical protein